MNSTPSTAPFSRRTVGRCGARYPKARFSTPPVATVRKTFALIRQPPGGLFQPRCITLASTGTYTRVHIQGDDSEVPSKLRPVARAPSFPWLRGWDVIPTDYYGRMPPSVQMVLLPTWRLVPWTFQGASHFRYCLHLRASGDSHQGWPWRYSPLPLASLRRVPVSDTVDSTTWGRWWLPLTPCRSLRFPAWRRGMVQVHPSLPPDRWATDGLERSVPWTR
jgi:hypothetical protein